MRAVIQRVISARVRVDGEIVGEIGRGFLTLLGVAKGDTEKELDWVLQKIVKLRVFEDQAGKMNLALGDIGGEHLIVSQFTLCADVSKGNRPSFIDAASPEVARPLVDKAIEMSRAMGIKTAGGKFQADMKVELINDGPVTIVVDSERG
jgi:D-tyrosyl-tRNA(Tyr) deacylase